MRLQFLNVVPKIAVLSIVLFSSPTLANNNNYGDDHGENSLSLAQDSIPSLEEFLSVCPLICTTQWHFEFTEFSSPAECVDRMCRNTPVMSQEKLLIAAAKNRTYSVSNVLRLCRPMCESEWWLDSLPFFESIEDCYDQICPQQQSMVIFNTKYDAEQQQQQLEQEREQKSHAIDDSQDQPTQVVKPKHVHNNNNNNIAKMVKPATKKIAPVNPQAIQAIINRRLQASNNNKQRNSNNSDKLPQQQSNAENQNPETQARPPTSQQRPTLHNQKVNDSKNVRNSKMTDLLKAAAKLHAAKGGAKRTGPTNNNNNKITSCRNHTECGNGHFCSKRKICAERARCSIGGYDQQPIDGLCPRSMPKLATATLV